MKYNFAESTSSLKMFSSPFSPTKNAYITPPMISSPKSSISSPQISIKQQSRKTPLSNLFIGTIYSKISPLNNLSPKDAFSQKQRIPIPSSSKHHSFSNKSAFNYLTQSSGNNIKNPQNDQPRPRKVSQQLIVTNQSQTDNKKYDKGKRQEIYRQRKATQYVIKESAEVLQQSPLLCKTNKGLPLTPKPQLSNKDFFSLKQSEITNIQIQKLKYQVKSTNGSPKYNLPRSYQLPEITKKAYLATNDKIKSNRKKFGSETVDKKSESSTNSSFRLQQGARNYIEDRKYTRGTQELKNEGISISDFNVGMKIGGGQFGAVFIAQHKTTGFMCAIKKISKLSALQKCIVEQIIRQIKIQSYLDHPNITKLYGVFDDQEHVYLILQLALFGQLYMLMKDKKSLPQSTIAYITKQICQAVRYLHTLKIIHRDIKPQNILMQHGIIKLCDFGWSVCRGSELRRTFCGTPLYASPEILSGRSYNEKIDLWSVGILVYEMLVGRIPFEIKTEQELVKIIKEQIKFPENSHISSQGQDFVMKLLQKDPKDRCNITLLIDHPFLKQSKDGLIRIQL